VAHVEKRQQRYSNGTLGPTTYRVRYRDPSGRERSKTFRKATDAERFKKVVDADLVRGEWHDPKPGRRLFREWVKEHAAEASKRPTTAARDAVVLRKHFLPVLGDFPLGSITPRDIQKIVSTMQTQLQPATVRTNYAVLSAVLSAAVQAELIPRSPCRGIRGIKAPRDTRKRRKGLTAEEVTSLATHVPKEYQGMIYVGALGLRFSEVAGLRVRGIDFLARQLKVSETVAEVEGRLLPADVKTDASERVLAVPPFLIAMLSEHLARTNRKKPDEYVFQAPLASLFHATAVELRRVVPTCVCSGR
jgi:integrase